MQRIIVALMGLVLLMTAMPANAGEASGNGQLWLVDCESHFVTEEFPLSGNYVFNGEGFTFSFWDDTDGDGIGDDQLGETTAVDDGEDRTGEVPTGADELYVCVYYVDMPVYELFTGEDLSWTYEDGLAA